MLKITRGDYKAVPVRVPFDLTGWTVMLTVKREADVNKDDPSDQMAVIKVDESQHAHPSADPVHGLTIVVIPESVTTAAPVGDYVYDIQLVDPDGRPRTAKRANGDLPPCQVTPQATQRSA